MQARRLVCKAIRHVEWETYDLPETLEPYQVLVKSACSLISAGTEIAVYSGSHIGFTLPNPPAWLRFPMHMGYALAGIVQAVGSEVDEWAAGDRVMVHAPHGDWALCDVRTTIIRRLPAAVSMEQGALARLAGISLVGIRQARIELGEAIVVLGLGLIGQFAARLSYLSGGRPVIGVDLIPRRVEIANVNGIHAINAHDVSVREFVEEMSDGRMAEVVIEATGNPQVVPTALDLAAEGGRVILLGSLRGKIEIDAYSTVHRKGVSLIGAHDRLSAHAGTFRDPWTRERNLDAVLSLIADGSLKAERFISHRIPPDDVRAVYEMLIERPGDFLGVLIEWDRKQNA
ncbi:MAG TPA: zinc-binding alcohol dehydrogenase [Anaerolineae bacterium]|nr:zinc-binding alcohol dehydrogenase [Anaerolineae bacterium]HIQ06035.1 zinc-binding alcohol dehydrogenase [Anaerolineae bacterium]